MLNIDPIFIMQPIVVTIIAFALMLYWRSKKRFTGIVLLASLAAYAAAIAVKVIFQYLTAGAVLATQNLFYEGLYFGLQTAVLEVGIAFLIARFMISKKRMDMNNAGAYGIGFAFWENGILLGLLPLISLILTYEVLASSSAAAATTYNALINSEPILFSPVSASVLLVIGLGILERTSSMIIHIAWGYLAFAAAFYSNKRYLAYALLMGFIDFSVPFANLLGISVYEIVIFAIALAALYVAVKISRNLKNSI